MPENNFSVSYELLYILSDFQIFKIDPVLLIYIQSH